MKKIEHIVTNERKISETSNLSKVLNKKVLSKSGSVIGKVKQLRINSDKLFFEGILVKRSLFKKSFYVGTSYLSQFSEDAIILNINPTILEKGKKVLAFDGEYLGKVSSVERQSNTNEIKNLLVKSFLKKEIKIPISAVKSIGSSIILNANYDVSKKYIWQKGD